MDISVNANVEITKKEIEEIIATPIEWGEDDDLYEFVKYCLGRLLSEGEFVQDDIENDEEVYERFIREGYEMAVREF